MHRDSRLLCFLSLLYVVTAQDNLPWNQQFPDMAPIAPSADIETQQEAANQLLKRLLPDHYQQFILIVDNRDLDNNGYDYFRIESSNATPAKVQITGTTGVAAVWGLHNYLKVFCKAHISWSGDQLNLPNVLPLPSVPVTLHALDRFRYHENVCTLSYSSVWWSWERWQREIDWMALQGINMPLVVDGQEEIWYRVYTKLGLTDDDLKSFFTGPAFLAWGRMGNIVGWGGPLTSNFRHYQLDLTRRILLQMRNLGMTPAVSAFSGHVPASLTRIFPSARTTQLQSWGHFKEPYCCTHVLDFNDALFAQIGKMFIEEQTAELGTDHIYSCDTFNEMTPPTNDTDYLSRSGHAVYQAMVDADPNATWLMQAWLFRSPFWQEPQVEALLTSVPIGRMIILDLEADVGPLYSKFQSFYGQPFIWCMLHNFGGTLGLYGAVENIINGPPTARRYPNSTMIGTGFTMEGIEQNAVMYELMAEMSLRPQPLTDPISWFHDYAERRYGVSEGVPFKIKRHVDKAWSYLGRSVYNCTNGLRFHGTYIFTRRPSFHAQPLIWYNPKELRSAWDHFISAARKLSVIGHGRETFLHDLIDVTREALHLITIDIYHQMWSSYSKKDLPRFLQSGSTLLDLLMDMDRVLATGDHFLLGTWLESAKHVGTDDYEKKLYEYNARNQITLWGPNGELVDYATKQWAGVVSGYYWPRWNLFIKEVKAALEAGVAFNQTTFNELVFKVVEEPFTLDNSTHRTTPFGDTFQVADEIYKKWRPSLRKYRYVKTAYKIYLHFHTVEPAKRGQRFRLSNWYFD